MFNVNDIKAFVKRSVGHDAEYKEAGMDIPYYVYAADGKVYELNSTTGFLLLTGQLDNIPYVRPFDMVDGDVTWNIEDDVISGYYKDGDMKIPVMDKHIAAYINKDNELTILDYTFMSTLLEQLTSVYVTLDVWAQAHDKSVPAAKRQCQLGRVCGAVQIGGSWFVPEYAPYPKREVADKKIYQVPECAISKTAFEFLTMMLYQGQTELGCGIKLDSCSGDGVLMSIILPDDIDMNMLKLFYMHMCSEDGKYTDNIKLVIPYSLYDLLVYAVKEGYTEISIMNHLQHSLITTNWKKNNSVSSDILDKDFGKNNFTLQDAVDYQTIVTYVWNNSESPYEGFNKIEQMNRLFVMSDDPIIRGCLVNLDSFIKYYDNEKLKDDTVKTCGDFNDYICNISYDAILRVENFNSKFLSRTAKFIDPWYFELLRNYLALVGDNKKVSMISNTDFIECILKSNDTTREYDYIMKMKNPVVSIQKAIEIVSEIIPFCYEADNSVK